MTDRVILAYSGGLDTSVAVRWLGVERGLEVVALVVDVGQGDDLEAVRERALRAGAVEAEVIDARGELASDFLTPALFANALYESKYPLVSALSRPLIARHLVVAARRHGATAVAHGCTGKGNDQVRFEVSVRSLAPELEVLAPVREWGMSRQEAMAYARRHGVPVPTTKERPYSIDENLWGRAIECGVLEDPWEVAPEDVFTLTRSPSEAPKLPAEAVLRFEEGVPVALDGNRLALPDLVPRLGALAGAYGFGRIDMVENRRVGIKSREVYECPGALALLLAHADLESVSCERDLLREKARLEPRYAELVYDGLWFSPLRRALDAFMASAQSHVTGEVRLLLAPGQCRVVGRRAENGLYQRHLATYEADDLFRHQDAAGFVRLFGLSVETWARCHGENSHGENSHGENSHGENSHGEKQ